MGLAFERLVRFKNASGKVFYGELGDLVPLKPQDLIGKEVPVFNGTVPWSDSFGATTQVEVISEVLSPIPATPIFQCVGLNYRSHTTEANTSLDKYPVIFTKPPDALAGPYDNIPINPECKLMDYEAELCVIIGMDCKNVQSKEEALQCILGYTAGNDVSSRFWQMPERSGGQHGTAKSFDKFAPLGPIILHPILVNEAHGLRLQTFVNGELRQDARTTDFIFDIPTIIIHLSRGTTLRKGTVIMTGTPGGVAAFRNPPPWLQHGDVVEVDIQDIGRIRNTMIFET